MNTENVEGPVNIGNPVEFTIKELAELVIEKGISREQLRGHIYYTTAGDII